MRLRNNMASMNIYRSYVKNLTSQSNSIERLSSGKKLNKAGDNPNRFSQSERYRLHVRTLQMAARNNQDGVSMLQTAEGGIKGINESIHRVRELVVQSGGALDDSDKEVIEKEINQMLDNIDTLSNNTEFNGVKLLGDKSVVDNSNPSFVLHKIGVQTDEDVKIPKYNLTSEGLGLKGDSGISLDDIGGSLEKLDKALTAVTKVGSKYGALENRFESNQKNLIEMSDRTQGAESIIRDTDVAFEMIELSRSSILVEAGNAMMVQTNRMPQDILRILENVRSR